MKNDDRNILYGKKFATVDPIVDDFKSGVTDDKSNTIQNALENYRDYIDELVNEVEKITSAFRRLQNCILIGIYYITVSEYRWYTSRWLELYKQKKY